MQPEHIINDAAFWLRMENWQRAVRDGIALSTCGSMEKRYRSPQMWHPEQPRIPIDIRDAEFMESTWRLLPMDVRLMVRYWWIRKMRPELIMRKMKVKPYLFDGEVRRSILLMHDLLEHAIANAGAIVYKHSKPEYTV